MPRKDPGSWPGLFSSPQLTLGLTFDGPTLGPSLGDIVAKIPAANERHVQINVM
jgi:hypothetical protein